MVAATGYLAQFTTPSEGATNLALAQPFLLTLEGSEGARHRATTPTAQSRARLDRLRPLIREAAARHNRLPGISDREFALWMEAILLNEMEGIAPSRSEAFSEVVYPAWQWLKVVGDLLGANNSLGIAQIRPETAAQIQRGWIEHGGRRIWHGVRVREEARGWGAFGVDPLRLAEDEVSIEYLAANLEMGAAVAARYGYVPSLEDLARWHNTGAGNWDVIYGRVAGDLWAKGSRYVGRVRSYLRSLREVQPLALLEMARS